MTEWKAFFNKVDEKAQVTFCTVVLDNEDLIDALALKKQYILELELMLPVGVSMDEKQLKSIVDKIPPLPQWKKLFATSASSLYEKIIALDNQIEELSQKEYDVSDIFVTFNTEEDQRNVLEKLSVGVLSIITQNKDALPSDYLFRGEHVLDVFEPAEPSSIRWQDLDETFLVSIIIRCTCINLLFFPIGLSFPLNNLYCTSSILIDTDSNKTKNDYIYSSINCDCRWWIHYCIM